MNRALSAAVAAAMTCSAAPAFAQLEEIVVTATRRVESLQDVPISVTAITGQSIQEFGFSDMEDLSSFVPNLQMRDTFVGQALYIRGIGTAVSNEAFEQAVATFADGVYYGRDNLSQNALFDLERVEVVRGPQPTFAGQSATAGALNIITRLPGDTWEGNLTAGYGSDEEQTLEFGMGGPVSDTFGIRFSGRYYTLDDAGYTRLLDGQELGIKENKAARISAVWSPTDNFDATFKFERQETYQRGTPNEYTRCDLNPQTSIAHTAVTPGIPALCALDLLYASPVIAQNGNTLETVNDMRGSGGRLSVWDAIDYLNAQSGALPGDPNYWGDPNSPVSRNLAGVYDYNQDEDRNTDANISSVLLNWDVGNLTFTSQTSFVNYNKKDWLDPDDSSFAIFTDLRLETFEQTAQEFRLTSNSDQAFSWMVGAYWQDHDLETEIDIYMPWLFFGADPTWSDGDISNGEYEARSFGGRLYEDSTWNSAFFAGTYNFTDALRLNFGGRYQDVSKNGLLIPTQALLPVGADAFGARFQAGAALEAPSDADDFLPEVGLQFDATDDIMVYAKYAEAFKAGGYVMSPVIAGALPDPFTYGPEHAEGLEFGLKGRFLADRNLEFNIVYFDTDFTDLQVTSFDSQRGQFITGNAAKALTQGFEFDGRWAATESFSLAFGGTVLDAHFVEHSEQCNSLDAKLWPGPGPCLNDVAGVDLPNTPQWQLTVNPEYRIMAGNYEVSIGANALFSDGYSLSTNGDPLHQVDSYNRLDLRVAVGPASGEWEIALYGRDVTDERLQIGWAPDFQNKSTALIYDAGGLALERGARWGIQGNVFFGN
jgi:outer membrane receptor protein involved in Fe transport